MPSFKLRPRGQFALAAAASFAHSFPGTEIEQAADGVRFAWPVDGDWRTVRTTLRQPGRVVQGELDRDPPDDLVKRARRDVERILCLDIDGSRFNDVGQQDQVVHALQQRYPGLRPVLFYTPYEAAAWAIIGQRIRMAQAAAIKVRLANELGEDGGFPAPDRLAALAAPVRGLTGRKIEQLRALGRAAQDGMLARERLRAMAPADAAGELQQLPGVGPFAAELTLVRGVGDPDALPRHEGRLGYAIRAAYGLAEGAATDPLTEAWRPFRAWVAFLLRVWYEAETGKSLAVGAPAKLAHA
jgi:3-methyladenine DNA glycosylase/8-oxoguanine DNA glycosylase